MSQIDHSFYVYHLIDPSTNMPFYVGKGSGNRMYKHEKSVINHKAPHNNRNLYFKIKTILDNGLKVIYRKIIQDVSEKQSFLREREEIKRIGKQVLCNATDGGQGSSGRKNTLAYKRRMSVLRLGKNNPFHGRKHSQEHKEKMRLLQSGKNNPFYGKRHSKKAKRKISKSLIGNSYAKGHKWSKKWRIYFSECQKGKKKRRHV